MSAWRHEGGALVRELAFRDHDEAQAFADTIAERAEDYHRHPDLVIALNRVRIVIENLHHAGITRAEQRLAEKVDAVLADRVAGPV
jgi:4a-hydroxytetrahydrobiopterin dehydratase